MQADQEADPQAAAGKLCSQTPSRENLGDGHFYLLPLHWAQVYSHCAICPFNNCFFVCYSPVGLMNASPTDFQSYVIWGPALLVVALKVGVLDVWSKCFGSWEFPLNFMCYAISGVYGKSMSQPLLPDLMWVFSVSWWVGITRLVSGFLLEGLDPCVAVYLVSPREEGTPGASCVTILLWSLIFIFFFVKMESTDSILLLLLIIIIFNNLNNSFEHLFCFSHYAKCLMYINSFNPYNHMRYILLITNCIGEKIGIKKGQ